jgi:ppGpp synthetase/RelA/SpoT-type nucleotidyltranferase
VVAKAEVEMLADQINTLLGGGAVVNSRTKSADGILQKVDRLVRGDNGRAPRPGYQVGDVIDAIGVSITVRNTEQLAKLLELVLSHFGTGDGGRILEVENFYSSPKSPFPGYRVIPMIVTVASAGEEFTFELQLTSNRASIAADVDHNTIYKPLLNATEAEVVTVIQAYNEAAALEQLNAIDDTSSAGALNGVVFHLLGLTLSVLWHGQSS